MGKIVGCVFEVGLRLAEMKKVAAFVSHCRVVLPVSGKISNFAVCDGTRRVRLLCPARHAVVGMNKYI